MRILLCLLLVGSFFSCQDTVAEKQSDKHAKAICSCAAQLMDLNKQAAQPGGKIDFEGIQAAFENTKNCIARQKIHPEAIPEVEQALGKLCPELAAEKELLDELIDK